jgi:hypothetical protein
MRIGLDSAAVGIEFMRPSWVVLAVTVLQVNSDGTWQVTGDPQKDAKGSVWKASYHCSRAPLSLEKWLQ